MRLFKSVLIASVASALLAMPAVAADLSARPVYKAAPAPIAAPAYSWSGFYIGGNAGAKWGDVDQTITSGSGAALGFSGSSDVSWLAGGQLGFMWQTGQFVFGVEGDIDATNLRHSFTAVAPTVAPFLPGDSLSIKNDWQASARGRLGYAWDRTLLYVTGGGAWGNIKAVGNFIPSGAGAGFIPGTTISRDRTVFGWTLGGGIDYGFAPGWSIGAEYRFTRFDNDNNNGNGFGVLTTTPGGATTPLAVASRLDTNEVTARLNYHFNWNGPVGGQY